MCVYRWGWWLVWPLAGVERQHVQGRKTAVLPGQRLGQNLTYDVPSCNQCKRYNKKSPRCQHMFARLSRSFDRKEMARKPINDLWTAHWIWLKSYQNWLQMMLLSFKVLLYKYKQGCYYAERWEKQDLKTHLKDTKQNLKISDNTLVMGTVENATRKAMSESRRKYYRGTTHLNHWIYPWINLTLYCATFISWKPAHCYYVLINFSFHPPNNCRVCALETSTLFSNRSAKETI